MSHQNATFALTVEKVERTTCVKTISLPEAGGQKLETFSFVVFTDLIREVTPVIDPEGFAVDRGSRSTYIRDRGLQ